MLFAEESKQSGKTSEVHCTLTASEGYDLSCSGQDGTCAVPDAMGTHPSPRCMVGLGYSLPKGPEPGFWLCGLRASPEATGAAKGGPIPPELWGKAPWQSGGDSDPCLWELHLLRSWSLLGPQPCAAWPLAQLRLAHLQTDTLAQPTTKDLMWWDRSCPATSGRLHHYWSPGKCQLPWCSNNLIQQLYKYYSKCGESHDSLRSIWETGHTSKPRGRQSRLTCVSRHYSSSEEWRFHLMRDGTAFLRVFWTAQCSK